MVPLRVEVAGEESTGSASSHPKSFEYFSYSTSSERVFSHAGNIVTDKRTLMSANILHDPLFWVWNHITINITKFLFVVSACYIGLISNLGVHFQKLSRG